jgi:uncharacterized repeat protein (TIGR01451 family)
MTFPVAVGPSLKKGGFDDAFVAKVLPDGSALAYCGYIGGALGDSGAGIAVDTFGNAYVAGTTQSPESSFPVTNGPNGRFSGNLDAFVAKVKADGSGLSYCGYIGGDNQDFSNAIAVDRYGNAFIAGLTFSSQTTFPVRIGPGLQFEGLADAFIAKIAATEEADLQVEIAPLLDQPQVGAFLTYQIQVTNLGPGPAESVTLSDTLSPRVALVGISPSGECTGGTRASCNLGRIEPGGSSSVRITIRPLIAGMTINTATVTVNPELTTDTNSGNNSFTTYTTVRR